MTLLVNPLYLNKVPVWRLAQLSPPAESKPTRRARMRGTSRVYQLADLGRETLNVNGHRHGPLKISPNDPAQQRRGPGELRTPETLHAPAVSCSVLCGPLLLEERDRPRLATARRSASA